MRVLLPITHEVHRRNLIASGAALVLKRHGLQVQAWAYTRRTFRRLRHILRLGSLVGRAKAGQRTYVHKISLPRPLLDRVAIAAWRRVRDPEGVGRRIEARLPVPAEAWKALDITRPTLILLSTMIHDDPADDLVNAARILGIPVIAAWASWDTGTSKGGHLVRPNALLVWGSASARQAERDHGFAQIAITGPPHWDHYFEPRAAKPRTKVLIAGTSVAYWRDEEEMAGRLTEDFPGRVIYRRHPRRGGEWSWKACLELRDQLDETAVVVAAFSTVIVEAALQGVPSCVVAFGRGLPPLAQYQHMAEVIAWRPGVSVHSDYNSLRESVGACLESDGDWPYWLLQSRAREVADADGRCRERIAEALAAYSKEGAWTRRS